jgi:two-component system, NarL family, sensor kinase
MILQTCSTKKKFVASLLCLALFSSIQLEAQVNLIDSLQRTLRTAKEDTVQVMILYQIGEQFEETNPDTALWYYTKAKLKSEQINFLAGRAMYASNAIVILNNRGKFKEALALCKEALALYKQKGTPKDRAIAYINMGSEWQYLSDLEVAAENYFEAKKIAEAIDDKRLQRIVNNNLASIFIDLEQYEKGKAYAEKSLQLATELKNDYAIASSTYNIANAELYLKNYEKALSRFKDIEAIGIRTDDYIVKLDGWLGSADVYKATADYENAESYFKKVIHFSTEKNAPEYEMYAYMGISDVYLKTERYALAEQSILNGITLAQQLGSTNELKDLYLKVSEVKEKAGNFKSALNFRKQFEVLNDSIVGEKSRANINLLEARFESEKKEQQIKQLEQETFIKDFSLRQNHYVIFVLIGSLLAVIAIAFLASRTHLQKKKILEKENALNQIKIDELEKEKQLLAGEAIIKGQEEERGRLAKDLHDGLGGLLSGVKFSLTNMKSTVILDVESALTFERSLDMLDHSITELRRVAHNMMPEVLVKFGLTEALKSYCDALVQAQILNISFQVIDFAQRLPASVEIILYRIVQELLNNVMKHAKATHVIIQLAQHENELNITLEDNGVGFDFQAHKLSGSVGSGLGNIRSRVAYLKGKLDIQSSEGRGTSVLITLHIP